jgi:hypothetical protein
VLEDASDTQDKYRLQHEDAMRIEEKGEAELRLARGIRKQARFEGDEDVGGRPQFAGDERVRKIRQLFTRGFRQRRRAGEDDGAFQYITPSSDQLLFMECALFASLARIYGDEDWARAHHWVLKEWNADRVREFVMVITARRMGKTV